MCPSYSAYNIYLRIHSAGATEEEEKEEDRVGVRRRRHLVSLLALYKEAII